MNHEARGRFGSTPRGWKLGLLIASNVDPDYGKLTKIKPWEDKGISRSWYRSHPQSLTSKISFRSFECEYGISDKTVKKYLITWDLASLDHLVPLSTILQPGSDFEFDDRHTPETWELYFKKLIDPCVYFIGHKGRPDLPVKIGKANFSDKHIRGEWFNLTEEDLEKLR